MSDTKVMPTAQVDDAFRAFVNDAGFPCLAGKGVVRSGGYGIGVFGALGSARGSRALAQELAAFSRDLPDERANLRAYVAIFPDSSPASEDEFERRLWLQLQELHEHDDPEVGWDPAANSDPDNPHFAFSFAGCAYFVVGLHPASSRVARRFRWPTLVFNPHAQFERLRDAGHFERLRASIREREIALQGSLNPNLADFGEQSEARQYSGRPAEPEWRCPFHPKSA
ncbi:MAG: YqcI/YcgG family protein [Gemmatimonadota bacterium]|nr:YqcI/YcgG family protein [Gemmatimonadota bacterium]